MFQGWENYFFMLGSASAGLIGLLFVVVTLTANFERSSALRGSALYLTPTMVHFSVVLAVCAASVAPRLPIWIAASVAAAAICAGGANAVRATLGIARPRPGAITPHWSDVWGYGAGPLALYGALLIADAGVYAGQDWAAEALAGGLLALMLLAIRNAWDLVTWMAPQGMVDPARLAPPSDGAD